MHGHGRPKNWKDTALVPTPGNWSGMILCLLAMTLCFLPVNSALAQEPVRFEPGTIRLNCTWSSEEPELWNGEFYMSQGRFSQSTILGNDPTNSQAFSFETENRGRITFSTPRQSLFCGLQTTIHGDLNAILTVNLRNPRWKETVTRSVALGDLVRGPVYVPFDNQENGLLIERAAGDDLPVVLQLADQKIPYPVGESPLVFEQGNRVRLAVFPRTAFYPGEEELSLNVRLTKPGQNQEEYWSESQNVSISSPKLQYDFIFTVPSIEGAFELQLSLNRKKQSFSLIPSRDKKKSQVLAVRAVQAVVVPPMSTSDERSLQKDFDRPFDLRNGLLETIDPTNPSWWKVFAKNPVFSGSPSVKREPTTILGQKNPTPSFDILRKWKWSDFQIRLTPSKLGSGWGQWDELWQHSLGSGHLKAYDTKQTQYASFAQLVPSRTPEIPWESYTIPIKEPGKPHLLEIEYLSHIPQKLGVSIIEPAISGGVFPNTIDCGLNVEAGPLSDVTPNRILNHQILFWPRTKAPMILLMNRDSDRPAVFGRIRLYRVKDEPAWPAPKGSGRSFAVVMTRPWFTDQFSAPRVAAPIGVSGAENWDTFYLGLDRTIKYLHSGGYDSLMLSVYADGSTIYPSNVLRPTPKFDGGIFQSKGEDPTRKDVVELAARLFEKKHLSLIPLINFNSPLPALEEYQRRITRDGTPEQVRYAEGIYSIGPEGRRFIDSRSSLTGTGPHYNILHPVVQHAMLDVIMELVTRYGRHSSLTGIAIELSANNSSQLPDDIYYGMDDETVGRFLRETRIMERMAATKSNEQNDHNRMTSLQAMLSATGIERFRIRAQFISDYCRDEWLEWRAKSLHQFYRTVRNALVASRPDLRLYLIGTEMLQGVQSKAGLYPTIARRTDLHAVLRNIGINPALYTGDSSLVLLRSGILSLNSELSEQIIPLELDTPESIGLYADGKATQGASFYHKPVTRNIPSFDRSCPFQPAMSQISTRMLPGDADNRQRFAHQLACSDTFSFFDGGDMIPMGQEAAIHDWISVFRRIPAAPFETYMPPTNENEDPKGKTSLQPVVLRTRQTEHATWGYLVNDAPFHSIVSLEIKHQRGAELEIFSGSVNVNEPRRDPLAMTWTLTLRPYDLIAFKVSDSQATIASVEITRPDEICGPEGRLSVAMRDYIDRILIARLGLPERIPNAGFEGEPLPTNTQPPRTDQAKAKSILGIDVPKFNLLKSPFGQTAESQKKSDNERSAAENTIRSPDEIDGWQRYGDPGFKAVLDENVRAEGMRSLKISCSGGAGSIVSSPVPYDGTGRLCLQMSFGIPANTTELPLCISLTGRYGAAPYHRQLSIGPTLLAKIARRIQDGSLKNENGIVWIEDVILFDRLPLSGLEDVSLRFDLLALGTVWLDNLRLYKMAFAEAEQKEILEIAGRAESAVAEMRVRDAIDMLDSYWSRLLVEQIPMDSPLMTRRPQRPIPIAETPTNEEKPVKEAKGFFDRLFSR